MGAKPTMIDVMTAINGIAASVKLELSEFKNAIETRLATIETIQKEYTKDATALTKCVFGNGTPEASLSTRVSVLEKSLRTIYNVVTPIFIAIIVGVLAFIWGVWTHKIVITGTP